MPDTTLDEAELKAGACRLTRAANATLPSHRASRRPRPPSIAPSRVLDSFPRVSRPSRRVDTHLFGRHRARLRLKEAPGDTARGPYEPRR